MRIAYVADETTGNGFYRSVAPMRALRHVLGHEVTALSGPRPKLPRGIELLHIHRYTDPHAIALARDAKAAGAVVVWDNDDDMGSVPRDSNAYRKVGGIRWERRLAAMRRLFGYCDLATATNETLAARLAQAGAPRTAWVENYLPAEFLRTSASPHDGVVVGWVAGLEHALDVERIPLREALARLLADRPDVRIHSIGLRLGIPDSRVSNVSLVPLAQLTQQAAAFDIAIAPLADIALNRARSNVKLKEYAAAGLPWLASPVGPYLGMGEKQGGRLVADDRWYEELSRLIDKERDRRKLAKKARKWVEGETIERNAYRWEQLFRETLARAGASVAG